MRRTTTLPLLARLVLLALSGCPSGPNARASFPAELAPIPADSFHAFDVRISWGSRTPLAVERLRARCADVKVCTTRVLEVTEDRWWPELQIIGQAPGATTVEIDYYHPTRKVELEHTMKVVFTSVPPVETIALARPLPATEYLVHQITAPGAAVPDGATGAPLIPLGRCRPGSSDAYRITGEGRPDVRLYDCIAPTEVLPGTHRYRSQFGRDDGYTLCVQAEGGVIAGTRVLQTRMRGGHLALEAKLTEGTFTGDVCAPRAGS